MVSCHIVVQITCSLWLFCRLVAAFKAFPGIPADRMLNSNSTKKLSAATQEECFTRICHKDQLCSAVFSAKERICFKIPELSPLVIFWGRKRILRPHKDFVTLVPIDPIWATIPPPVALWLLDEDYQGTNLGTGGSNMDIFSLMRLSRVFGYSFDGKGPHSLNTTVGYLKVFPKNYDGFFRFYGKISIHGRIDFEKGFTISLWIKSEDNSVTILYPIFDWLTGSFSMSMYFYPRTDQVAIDHTGEHRDLSYSKEMNPKDVKEWRHIAASYEGGKGTVSSFYVNGRLMQLEKSSNATMKTPKEAAVFMEEWSLQMRACHLIFDKPLSQKQVRHVMDRCP